MLITIICLLQLFSHLQPARGETTGELLKSVGKRTPRGSYDEIVCSFNVNVSLSRVDFVNNTGSEVFAIVDCGTSCNVRSSYQDVLRIISPENTISGDYFVFSATHSEKTTGSYTCHGIPIPQVASPPPSGTGDDDGDGDGEESHKTSALPPETDEASHNAGGSSNGLLALLIIPILVVLIVVVLLLHWRRVIQIPCLWKTGGGQEEPRDLRSILGNLLQPFPRCWERIRHLWQSTPESKDRKSNYDQDEEATNEAKAFLYQNEDKPPVHLGAAQGKSYLPYPVEVSVDIEGKDDEMSVFKEQQPLMRESYDNTKPTQDENAEECHTLPQSTLSSKSTEAKDEIGDVEERQTSRKSSHLSNSITSPEVQPVSADLSAASLSDVGIQHKGESPNTNTNPLKPVVPPKRHKDTKQRYRALTPPSGNRELRDATSDSCLPSPASTSVTESEDNDKIDRPSLTFSLKLGDAKPKNDELEDMKYHRDRGISLQHTPASSSVIESEDGDKTFSLTLSDAEPKNDDLSKKKDIRDRGISLQHTPHKSGTRVENESMKGQLTAARNKEGMEGQEEREGERARVDMEEKESCEAKSETINNDDMKGQLTTDQTKQDVDGKKEREENRAKVEMEEKETENKKDTRQKQKQIEETMAKAEQEHKKEAKSEVEQAHELEIEAVREHKADTSAERVQTRKELKKQDSKEDDDYETASDDDDGNSSRDSEGAADVDKLDGASSTVQNLLYTNPSLPTHSSEPSDEEKRQTIRGKLKRLSSKFQAFDDNSLDV